MFLFWMSFIILHHFKDKISLKWNIYLINMVKAKIIIMDILRLQVAGY